MEVLAIGADIAIGDAKRYIPVLSYFILSQRIASFPFPSHLIALTCFPELE
jgi:hypothetical protein